MRSRTRDRQDIWFSTVTEKKIGIDTIQEYAKPVKKRMSVSTGTGLPGQVSAGLVVDYDREILNYDHDFLQVEGNVVWVDVIPDIDDEGNLVMSDDEVTPTVPPDYRITQIFRTAKGHVDVFGIKKIGGNNGYSKD